MVLTIPEKGLVLIFPAHFPPPPKDPWFKITQHSQCPRFLPMAFSSHTAIPDSESQLLYLIAWGCQGLLRTQHVPCYLSALYDPLSLPKPVQTVSALNVQVLSQAHLQSQDLRG
jgi:hypothetical protein